MLAPTSFHPALLWLVSSLVLLTAQDSFAQSISASSSSSSSASSDAGQTASAQSSIATTDAGSRNTVSVTSINNSPPLTSTTVTTQPTAMVTTVRQSAPMSDAAAASSGLTRIDNAGQIKFPVADFSSFSRGISSMPMPGLAMPRP